MVYLSICISQNSFIYSISLTHYKNIVELNHIEFLETTNASSNINDIIFSIIQNHLLHQIKFEKINIAVLNKEFTLVPDVYAIDSDLKSMLKFSTGLTEINTVSVNHLNGFNFCYSIHSDLINQLEKTFTNAVIRHAGALSINLFFSQHSLINSNLFLNINDEFIEIMAKEKNNLIFYNVFNYQTDEDILYYLLFMMEQFNLDPLHVKLSIASQRQIDDELNKSLKKYIKQVTFCVSDPSVNFMGELNQLPQHFYFTLLNQHLCEL